MYNKELKEKIKKEIIQTSGFKRKARILERIKNIAPNITQYHKKL
jgi:hypothetical protein